MNPKMMAEKGDKIYQEKYQQEYEEKYPGKLVAISLNTEQLYMGESPVEAIQAAQKAEPDSLFHLIRVGSASVYSFAYSSPSSGNRVF